MDSPLTPGMSSLLYFGDDTFEYPTLEAENSFPTSPGAKDLGIDSPRLIENPESRRLLRSSSRKTDATTGVQTPALTTGPSAVYPNSTSASLASPSVAAVDYFTRARQPNSDGSVAHFNTGSKLGESNDFSEFRKAIDNRFRAAKNAQSNHSNDPSHPSPPAREPRSFASSQYPTQPTHDDDLQHEQLNVALESVMLDSRPDFPNLHDPARFQYPEVDPALEPGPFAPATQMTSRHKPPTAVPKNNDAPPTKVIKRRRRRKAPPTAEVQAQKHKAFLERNREAASKCRTKKKSQVQCLEESEREGRALNLLLKEEFKVVLGEVLLYREQVKLLELACAGKCRARGLVESSNEDGAAVVPMDGIVRQRDGEPEHHGLASATAEPNSEGSAAKWESGSESITNEDEDDFVERRRKRSSSNKSRGEGVET